MSLRSRYREKPTEALNNIPEVKLDGAEPEAVTGISVEAPPGAEPAVGIVDAAEYPEPSETSEVLRRQLEHLRTSEELQRRHAQQMAQHAQPPTREQKLDAWRGQGMSEAEARFLSENPELIDNPQLTAYAAGEAAQQGHQRGTESHMTATREIFHQHLAHLQEQQAQAQPAAADPAGFFRPHLRRHPRRQAPRPCTLRRPAVARSAALGSPNTRAK